VFDICVIKDSGVKRCNNYEIPGTLSCSRFARFGPIAGADGRSARSLERSDPGVWHLHGRDAQRDHMRLSDKVDDMSKQSMPFCPNTPPPIGRRVKPDLRDAPGRSAGAGHAESNERQVKNERADAFNQRSEDFD
jgi:hypothetical protein